MVSSGRLSSLTLHSYYTIGFRFCQALFYFFFGSSESQDSAHTFQWLGSLNLVYSLYHTFGSLSRGFFIFFRELLSLSLMESRASQVPQLSLPLTIIVYHKSQKKQDGKMHKLVLHKYNFFVHFAGRPGKTSPH